MMQPQSSPSDASGELGEAQPAQEQREPVEIVQVARAGNQQAFTQLYERYHGPICTYLAHLVGNDEVGRDLAQETFIRAWKGLPKLQDDLSFRHWLYRIATNVARSYRRQERSWLVRWLPWRDDEKDASGRDNTPGALSIAGPEEQAGEREHIRQVLIALAPQARTCLLLQHVAGFTQREIAAILGISEKSVSAYVSRGCEQFRQRYRQMR